MGKCKIKEKAKLVQELATAYKGIQNIAVNTTPAVASKI